MQIEMPFYETPESALRACIEHLGGAKEVGRKMFPDKTIENARDYLLACVNEGRPEKLAPTQILLIFREAKAAGFHAGFQWWSSQCEYEARPITKAEEVDRLTTIIEQSSKTLAGAVALLEKMQGNSRY
jgi:hypothetical protein